MMRNLIVLGLLAFSTAASAGYHLAQEVDTRVFTHGGSVHVIALGSVAGALASDDENQVIECSVNSYRIGGTPTTYGGCFATDPDGLTTVSCYSDDPEMIDTMRMINETSFIQFTGRDGICTSLGVWNGSKSL